MVSSRPTALVVDDDPALRMLCRVNLELDGFVVSEAGTIAEADEVVAAGKPDVVLLDVHLGSVESTPLLSRLREAGIPVVLVTGSVDTDEYHGRADAIVTKPFIPQQLVALARRLARVAS
jgi:DNA-binding response OmpR family regulator